MVGGALLLPPVGPGDITLSPLSSWQGELGVPDTGFFPVPCLLAVPKQSQDCWDRAPEESPPASGMARPHCGL